MDSSSLTFPFVLVEIINELLSDFQGLTTCLNSLVYLIHLQNILGLHLLDQIIFEMRLMLYFDLLLIKCYAVGFEFVKNLYDSDLLKFLCFQSISLLAFEVTRLSHLFNFVLVYLTFDFTFLIPFSCFLKKTL